MRRIWGVAHSSPATPPLVNASRPRRSAGGLGLGLSQHQSTSPVDPTSYVDPTACRPPASIYFTPLSSCRRCHRITALRPLPLSPSADVPEVAIACTEALRSLEVNSSRDTSRNSSVAVPPGAGAVADRVASAGSCSGSSGTGVPAMARLGTWGRRGSQSIPLEQAPPEDAAAEVSAEAAAAPAGPPPAAAPPSLEAVAAAAAAAIGELSLGPATSGPLSPPGLPRPPSRGRSGLAPSPQPSTRGGQPQVQSVPLPTSPFAGDGAPPSPSFVE